MKIFRLRNSPASPVAGRRRATFPIRFERLALFRLIPALLVFGAWWPCIGSAQTGHGQVVALVASNQSAQLTFATTPGASYQLQQNDALGTRWWRDGGTAAAATGTSAVVAGSASATSQFFRVLEFTNDVFWYDWTYRRQDPFLAAWGFGAAESAYSHLDRPYDWYVDQADTGAASQNNCGPSSVAMALKWRDGSYSGTAEEARDWSYAWRGNGWWYTSDITNYLAQHAAHPVTSAYTGTNQLRALIAEGKLLVLCVNTAYLARNSNGEQRIDRFYDYAGGHFLAVKGARSVSGNLLFEVYDPNNWHALYADGTPKGKNRHLRAPELAAAITNWWNYVIVVPPSGGGGAAARLDSKWLVPVDPETIAPAWGR